MMRASDDCRGSFVGGNVPLSVEISGGSDWEIQADAKIRSGDLEGAISVFDAAIHSNPKLVTAWAKRGCTKNNLGDHIGAITDCNVALGLDRLCEMAWDVRGGAKHQLEDYQGTISDCDAALNLSTGRRFSSSRANRGSARYRTGDNWRAIEDCSAALFTDPQRPSSFRHCMQSHISADLAPTMVCFAGAWATRGAARKELGDYAGAIADCTVAIRLDPSLSSAWANRGGAKKDLDDYRGAIADCDEALRLDPRCAIALVNRAGAKHIMGEFHASIDDCDAALRLRPANARLWTSRGSSRYMLGDNYGAVADCNRALRLDPTDAFASDLRQRSLQRSGRHSSTHVVPLASPSVYPSQTATSQAVPTGLCFCQTAFAAASQMVPTCATATLRESMQRQKWTRLRHAAALASRTTQAVEACFQSGAERIIILEIKGTDALSDAAWESLMFHVETGVIQSKSSCATWERIYEARVRIDEFLSMYTNIAQGTCFVVVAAAPEADLDRIVATLRSNQNIKESFLAQAPVPEPPQ
eukprot:TRINITY_DN29486_c0_g2_i1.p1 TRINITY_DN29486_c0_g2~~TRINITY_DN29486_c0_g2_i1.p1  ORF type:complete len:529 (-),score=78.29 TRINITY_DN29486_c0_g2_i1:101-1687(-)